MTDGVWRWTKPFSITSVGSQSVDVYIGTHTALVNVTVINIGGLQKQVLCVCVCVCVCVSVRESMILYIVCVKTDSQPDLLRNWSTSFEAGQKF